MPVITTQDEMLKNAQFYPIFGPDGEIEGISQLSVATDRRLGVRAMEDILAEHQPGDEAVLQTGWTMKQHRILKSTAPAAAHYLKPSKKFDATSGEMVPSMTIIMPYEVTWRLFELLFDGQYSIDVKNLTTETEDVLSVSGSVANSSENGKSDDVPGRIFYTRAEVAITLHLHNGQDRTYTGVGVAYANVSQQKSGNVYAINSARRTADKGAVSDAKREAISTIGRVFRRAYEDGDEMVQIFEEMLIKKLQEANKPQKPARAQGAEKVAAPTARRQPTEQVAKKEVLANQPASSAPQEAEKSEPKDEVPFDKFEQETSFHQGYSVYSEGQMIDQSDDPDLYFERISELLSEMDDEHSTTQLLNENAATLREAEANSKEGNTVDMLKELVSSSIQDDPEEDDVKSDVKSSKPKEEDKASRVKEPASKDADTSNVWELKVSRPTGSIILDAYEKAFKKAKSVKDVDNILDANAVLAKRLTTTQKGKLLKATLNAKRSLS